MATPPSLWPRAKKGDSFAKYRTCIDRQKENWRSLTNEIWSILPKTAAAWRTSKKETSPSTEKMQVASCSGVGGGLAVEAAAGNAGGTWQRRGQWT